MTSEYVTIAHPDRMADYISEYILDRYLERDLNTRYALEVQVKDNFVTLAGEVTSSIDFTHEDYLSFVKNALREIGYTEEYADEWGEGNTIDPRKVEVTEHISKQSPDISQGVDNLGWGDQGIFWGMAIDDKALNYMPRDYFVAMRLANLLYSKRYGGLDIKTQVTMNNGNVEKVVVAIPILEKDEKSEKEGVTAFVKSICGEKVKVIVNGTGRYIRHSSMGDCGTTGRKLAVDFYGGNCRIGGGSPWTKDPTKADLTLNIYARKKAIEYLKEHHLNECHCQIECCIGQREITIQYYDGQMRLLETVQECKSNEEIIKELNLRRPIYTQLAREGLFSLL